MKKKIYFRADASVDIGYGHFVRTLALADMLKEDFDCTFFTVNPTPYQIAEMESVCRYVPLQQDTCFDAFLSLLYGDEIVVLDNYFYTTDYQRQIKNKGCRLVCIDDMHDKHYVADVVINHALTNTSLFDIEPYTKLCLGYKWALLRKPFHHATRLLSRRKIDISKVMVCFGGTDYYNLTGKFINILLKNKQIQKVTAIVGDAYNIENRIDSPKVNYCHNLSAIELVELFHNVDLSILPTSTICLEALACNALVAAGYFVDNQAEVYKEYTSKHLILSLGNLRDKNIEMLSLDQLLRNSSRLIELDSFGEIPLKYKNLFSIL